MQGLLHYIPLSIWRFRESNIAVSLTCSKCIRVFDLIWLIDWLIWLYLKRVKHITVSAKTLIAQWPSLFWKTSTKAHWLKIFRERCQFLPEKSCEKIFFQENHPSPSKLVNNYSPKAKWLLVNKNRNEVEFFIHRYSLSLRWIIVLV